MNKKLLYILAALVVISCGSKPGTESGVAEAGQFKSADTEIYFSPDGGAEGAIVSAVNGAQKEVIAAVYTFTSTPIAKALSDAKARGVAVEVIMDSSMQTAKYSVGDFLANHGVPVFYDGNHKIMHNKYIVLDREIVITGSFNFTKSAEADNAENLLVLHRPDLVAPYVADYLRHRGHSVFYVGKN